MKLFYNNVYGRFVVSRYQNLLKNKGKKIFLLLTSMINTAENFNLEPEEILLASPEQLKQAYIKEAENPTANDEYISNFCLAGVSELNSGVLTPFVESMISMQSNRNRMMTDEEAVFFTYRVFQKFALRTHPDYPDGFTEEKWCELIHHVIANDAEELETDLMLRHVQSNISERGINLHAMLVMFESRIGNRPRVLDVGCSLNEILEREVLLPILPYHSREVVLKDEHGNIFVSEEASASLDKALGTRVLLGGGTGIDLENIADPKVREHARACSLYANEWKNKDKVSVFDFLATKIYLDVYPRQHMSRRVLQEHNDKTEVIAQGINFFHADFADDEMMAAFPENPIQEFDAVFMGASIHQNNKDAQQKIINRAIEMAPNGLIFILDVVDEDPSEPFGLRFHTAGKFKTPFSFNLYVIDPNDRDHGPQLMWSNKTGRCDTIMLGDGTVLVNGEYKSAAQLLGVTS